MRNTAVAHPRVEVGSCLSQYFCSVLLFSDSVMLPVHRRDARAAEEGVGVLVAALEGVLLQQQLYRPVRTPLLHRADKLAT